MILDYESFKNRLEQLVKYRSKNYVNTSCDISVLIATVYSELSMEVNFAYEIQELELKPNVYDYQLQNKSMYIGDPMTNIDPDTGEPIDIIAASESFLTDTYDIVDYRGEDVSNYFTEVGYGHFLLNDENPFNMGTDIIMFLRKKIPDIKEIEPPMYDMILRAMIEGLMFQIQDSVPSQVDGQLANLQYQRFFNAKKELRLKLPQYEWFDVVGTGTNGYIPISKGL